VQTSGGAGTATHNVVCDNNTVKPGSKGLTNISATTCVTNNCLSTSASELHNIHVQLYPNPSVDFIEIKSDENIGKFVIVDLLGKIILQGNQNGNSVTIDVSNLESGLYFYQNSAQQTMKFIKE
jgi:hypothetical protein